MEEIVGMKLMSIGIQGSLMMAMDEDYHAVYEHVGSYLYKELKEYQGIQVINIFVIDEKGEFFQSEVRCDGISTRQGFDVIPVHHYLSSIEGFFGPPQYFADQMYHTRFPLRYRNRIIAILEVNHVEKMDDGFMKYMSILCNALIIGIHDRYLDRRNRLQKQAIDMITSVTIHLQNLTTMSQLVDSFAKDTAAYLVFDRVTLFLYDEKLQVKLAHCVDCRGNTYPVNHIPKIPILENGPKPLSGLSGYWFPLRTSNREIGAVLFDNIYSSFVFPEWNNDILLSLCNQFSIAVENYELFYTVQKAARKDKLTGLYNRAYFEEIIVDLEKQLPLSLIIGDVNGLKVTNDVFGHMEGDKLLVHIGDILKNVCRTSDVIFRWGGDEFIVLLPYTDRIHAEEICKKVKTKCEKEEELAVKLSISLGYETKEKEEDDLLSVLKKAEDMMYSRKQIERGDFTKNFMISIRKFLEDYCGEDREYMEMLCGLSQEFGNLVELSPEEIGKLHSLCLFHDVGKIGLNRDVLKENVGVDTDEAEVLKKHVTIGARIARTALEMGHIEEEILCHHEHFDGTGYPLGKKGEEIPKLSRIFLILESYVDMVVGTPDSERMEPSLAIERIKDSAGIYFDPFYTKRFYVFVKNKIAK